MDGDLDDRSPLSIGLDWSARITSIGLEFVLPALIGAGLDRWLDTRPLGTLGGAVLGFGVGMVHLIKIASQAPGRKGSKGPP